MAAAIAGIAPRTPLRPAKAAKSRTNPIAWVANFSEAAADLIIRADREAEIAERKRATRRAVTITIAAGATSPTAGPTDKARPAPRAAAPRPNPPDKTSPGALDWSSSANPT